MADKFMKMSRLARRFIRRPSVRPYTRAIPEHGEEWMNVKGAVGSWMFPQPPYWYPKIMRTALMLGLLYASWAPLWLFVRCKVKRKAN